MTTEINGVLPAWDLFHTCLCLGSDARMCLSLSGQRGLCTHIACSQKAPFREAGSHCWSRRHIAEVGISFLHQSLPGSPRASVNNAHSWKGSLAVTSLALALLPKFIFPLGWYDSHACSGLQLPSPSYSTGTCVTSQLQSCHVYTGCKDNACHHLEGITAAVFQQSWVGGRRGNVRLAQLYGVFGCAELNGTFCPTSLSSGWLLFCWLFVFYQPDKLLLDVCWVCLLVVF